MVVINAWNVRNDQQRTYGPFDRVQFTYELIRVPEDQELASFQETCQTPGPGDITQATDGWVFSDGFTASDFTIADASANAA
jgi:hypothetical protein